MQQNFPLAKSFDKCYNIIKCNNKDNDDTCNNNTCRGTRYKS